MFSFTSKGDWKRTERFFKYAQDSNNFLKNLERYANAGAIALSNATPRDTGLTAECWSYRITRAKNKISIIWENSNMVDGTPIVVLLQYGHGTGSGGYVQGQDFINPAIKPMMDTIVDQMWKEVTRA